MRKPKPRIIAIAFKEFLHIIHDPRSLIIIFVFPIIMLTMFGYAMNLEIQRVDMAVIDFNQTPLSRNLIAKFKGNNYFYLHPYEGEYSEIEELFLSRQDRAILIIDKDFDTAFLREKSTTVQLLIDATDPNAATFIQFYCNTVISEFNQTDNIKNLLGFEIKPRIWYNPDLKSAYFFVPGLVALILIMISALLTSITIAREKETGTMEQFLVSPVKPREIIIGKVLPYVMMAFLDGVIILVAGMILFNVPFTGNSFLLAFMMILYILTALSLGIMISTIVKTQQVAMMIALVATLLPTLMLSGFIFPVKSMPMLLQYLTYLVPAKYFLIILRGIMLKGNDLLQLILQAAFLFGMTVLLLRNALRKFSLNLEN